MQFDWREWRALDIDALYAALALRQRVFVVEQRCHYLDADGRDPEALHLLARRGGALVGYLRVLPPTGGDPPRIGRVVTSPEARGTGLGRPLMHEGMRGARERHGAVPIRIEAQSHLAAFYGSLGFVIVGPEYDEDGIPHVPMVCPP